MILAHSATAMVAIRKYAPFSRSSGFPRINASPAEMAMPIHMVIQGDAPNLSAPTATV